MIAIGKLKDGSNTTNLNNENIDKQNLADYTSSIFLSGCYYFDVDDHMWKYISGLKTMKLNISHTVCQTPLFSEISSGFTVAPIESDMQLIYA